MEALDHSQFIRKIRIKASPESLWPLWTSSKGLCSWFLEACTFTAPGGEKRKPDERCSKGDRYSFKWYNWDTVETGRVLEVDSHRFEFEFASSKVLVRIEAEGSDALLILHQYDIPEDPESLFKIHFGCSNGWSFWLTNLKAYVEHKILLNDKDPGPANDPMAPFHFVNL